MSADNMPASDSKKSYSAFEEAALIPAVKTILQNSHDEVSKAQIAKDRQPPAKLVYNVAASLRKAGQQYAHDNQAQMVFSNAYANMTEAIWSKFQDPMDAFQHEYWIATLDHAFAHYYLRACVAFDKEEVKPGPIAATTPLDIDRIGFQLWANVFQFLNEGRNAWVWSRPIVLEHLILPMIIHTSYDLPLAIASMAVSEAKFLHQETLRSAIDKPMNERIVPPEIIPPFSKAWYQQKKYLQGDDLVADFSKHQRAKAQAFQAYIHDYKKISDILAGLDIVDQIQEEVKVQNKLLNWLDRWLGTVEEELTYRGLQAIRGMVWYDATRLIEAEDEAAGEKVIISIKERTENLLELVSKPSSWLLQGLIILYRLVSYLARSMVAMIVVLVIMGAVVLSFVTWLLAQIL